MDPSEMAGLSMGGGSSLDAGGSSSMKGGDNKVGGTSFGSYTAASKTSWVPWLVVGVVVLGSVIMMKGGK